MDEATFVIRIYRRARAGSGRRRHDRIALAGLVEDVEIGERHAFHDIEELWTILSHTARKGHKFERR
jgi:hypothetical protein